MRIERSHQGEALDALVWRALGHHRPSYIAALLAHKQNAHLSRQGVFLDFGTAVTLPDEDSEALEVAPNPGRLWR